MTIQKFIHQLPPRRRLRKYLLATYIAWLRLSDARYLKHKNISAIEVDIGAFPYMGFGASIGWLQCAYIAAEYFTAELRILNPDRWPFGGQNSNGSLTKFIDLPSTEIRYGDPSDDALQMHFNDWMELSKWGYHDNITAPNNLFGYMPEKFTSLDEYRSSTLRQMYCPSSFARAEIEKLCTFLPERYIVWHARRGDKTAGRWKEDEPVELEDYVDATLQACGDHGDLPSAIVICSDSQDVVEQAQQIVTQRLPGWEIHADPLEQRWNGFCALQRTGKIDDSQVILDEVLSAQKNLEIMRRSDYLIGCNSSCLFRTAALLRPNLSRVESLSENKVWKKHFPI